MARKKLGELLIEEGVLDETRLRVALLEQQRWGGPLGRLLVDMKLVDEDSLVTALSRQLHVPTVDLDAMEIPMAVIELVPADLAEQHSVVPFAQPMKFLDLAMTDPTNMGIADELQIRTRLNVRPHLAGPKAIERAISRYYGRGIGMAFRRGSSTQPPQTKSIEIGVSERELEIVRPTTARSSDPGGFGGAVTSSPDRDAEIQALQSRVSRLEALIARDENVLRKVLSLLVEKGVASREEILERLK